MTEHLVSPYEMAGGKVTLFARDFSWRSERLESWVTAPHARLHRKPVYLHQKRIEAWCLSTPARARRIRSGCRPIPPSYSHRGSPAPSARPRRPRRRRLHAARETAPPRPAAPWPYPWMSFPETWPRQAKDSSDFAGKCLPQSPILSGYLRECYEHRATPDKRTRIVYRRRDGVLTLRSLDVPLAHPSVPNRTPHRSSRRAAKAGRRADAQADIASGRSYSTGGWQHHCCVLQCS